MNFSACCLTQATYIAILINFVHNGHLNLVHFYTVNETTGVGFVASAPFQLYY